MGFLDLFRPRATGISRLSARTSAVEEPTRTVEAIVTSLRRAPPGKAFCHLVLFGDRPLTAPMGGSECACIFGSAVQAQTFIAGYKSYYACRQPLSVLSVPSAPELWAVIHARSQDPTFKLPLGLIVNFSYAGARCHSFTVAQVDRMGPSGIGRGLQAVL